MNQEKIGKFIQELRKENKMTQQGLADRLNVTDRAVGNWENGRRMPDYSILKQLCEELNISVNELLNGERIKKEEIKEKTEEVIINTVSYSNKKIKNIKLIFTLSISLILLVIITFSVLFGIDVSRMKNNKEVLFSTWGFDYYPPINLDEENIEKAIKDFIIEEDEKISHHENEKSFAAVKMFLIEEKEDETIAYAWILTKKYYLEEENIKEDSSSSIPYKIKLIKEKNQYKVIEYKMPRDGSYYKKDIKELFPNSVRNQIKKVHSNGTFEKLDFEINEQVDLYFQNK